MGKEPEQWFKQAQYDLSTAEAMFAAKKYIYVIFMCHLAIEKALKGLYSKKFGNIPPEDLQQMKKDYPRQKSEQLLVKSKDVLKNGSNKSFGSN
jgi:HEPN domain-containing protein